MAVVHTAGLPPSGGSSIRAAMGWTRNTSAEATKIVAAQGVTPARRATRGGGVRAA